MRYFITILFLLQLFFPELNSQVKYSSDFLNIGIGARNIAMSNATMASVSDISAGYYNPSGLNSTQNTWNIGAMHSEYFAGIANFDYLSVAKKLDDNSTLGASIVRLGVDGIQNTTNLIDKDGNFDYDRITKFSVADYAFILSFAKLSKIEGLKIGGNSKIIYRNIGAFANAWGLGFDIGTQYKKNDWLFGATVRDVTSTFNMWFFNEDELKINVLDSIFNLAPENSIEITRPRIIAGAARYFQLKNKFGLLGELDLEITTDGERHTIISFNPFSIDPKLGIEGDYNKMLFLRFGLGNFQKVPSFDKEEMTFQTNFGLGIKFKNIDIDYALTDLGDQSIALYSHIFSINYSF